MLSVLPHTQVRVAFLKAIGCHEAARQQNTVTTTSRRRLSNSTTGTTFWSIFKKPFRRTKTLNCDDITSFQVNDVSRVLDTSVPQHYNPFPSSPHPPTHLHIPTPTHLNTYTKQSSAFSGSIIIARPNSSYIQHHELHDITEGNNHSLGEACGLNAPFISHTTPSPHTLPPSPHTLIPHPTHYPLHLTHSPLTHYRQGEFLK